MQQLGWTLTFSPSDLNRFVECEHLTTLDVLAAARRGIKKENALYATLVRAKGIEHEGAWLDKVRGTARSVTTIAGDGTIDWAIDAARTERAMRDGADVIY